MLVWVFVDGFGLSAGQASGRTERAMPFVCRSLGPGWGKARRRRQGPLARLWPTDARMGVAGLPQTATGQAALLTGKNAAKAMGRHIPAFPGPTLRAFIDQGNIIEEAVRAGRSVVLLNGYRVAPTARRETAFAYACRKAGVPWRTYGDAARRTAVAGDLELFAAPRMSPWRLCRRRAQRLAGAVSKCRPDVALFEYSLPDLVGHGRAELSPSAVLAALDGFLLGIYLRLRLEDSLLWTGDHGNLEVPTRRGHTLNFVPTILWPNSAVPTTWPGQGETNPGLMDVTRLIRHLVFSDSPARRTRP